eukprot:scaffold6834_cov113-Skeletonema_dohrnii-CCMP3373.AAC.4
MGWIVLDRGEVLMKKTEQNKRRQRVPCIFNFNLAAAGKQSAADPAPSRVSGCCSQASRAGRAIITHRYRDESTYLHESEKAVEIAQPNIVEIVGSS